MDGLIKLNLAVILVAAVIPEEGSLLGQINKTSNIWYVVNKVKVLFCPNQKRRSETV